MNKQVLNLICAFNYTAFMSIKESLEIGIKI